MGRESARYAPEPNVSTHRSVAPTVPEELTEAQQGVRGPDTAPEDEEQDRNPLIGGGERAVEPRLTGQAARNEHEPLDLVHAEEGELERRETAGIGGDEHHAVEPDPFEEVLHPGGDVLAVGRQLGG